MGFARSQIKVQLLLSGQLGLTQHRSPSRAAPAPEPDFGKSASPGAQPEHCPTFSPSLCSLQTETAQKKVSCKTEVHTAPTLCRVADTPLPMGSFLNLRKLPQGHNI